MPNRRASAVWEGGLKGGKGTFKGESGAIGGNYSFSSRFEEGVGSNPEELLAANAVCTIEKAGAGFKITTMRLTTRATVPNIDAAKFQEIANAAKEGCPVSQALKGNLNVILDASLA
jgi:lipoyl-dependent peroxiredoxin